MRITNEGSLKDRLVLFEREDMYVCGVSVGAADMRLLIRPGDKISLQVNPKFVVGKRSNSTPSSLLRSSSSLPILCKGPVLHCSLCKGPVLHYFLCKGLVLH